jgi:hypothetical protein
MTAKLSVFRIGSPVFIGRVTHDRLLLCCALAKEVTYDHQTRGNANPNLERHSSTIIELPDSFDQRQSRAHSPLGILLMGLGVAKIGQDAVSHVLGDETTGLGDDLGAAAVVGADDGSQVLGVEPGRQRGGTDEVTKT